MDHLKHKEHKAIITFAVGALILYLALGSTQGADNSKDVTKKFDPEKLIKSEDEADSEKCWKQLNIISDALRRYEKERDRLPNWLSDLNPQYLNNPENLGCPYVRNSGKTTEWRRNLNIFPVYGDPRFTTYGYELSTAEMPDLIGTTCRQYKQRQMQVLGFGVPIARCLAHKRVLNLAYDGTIYQSDLFWEDVFLDPAVESVLHDTIDESLAEVVVLRLLRPRVRDISSNCIDLTKYYNATLFHLSRISYNGELIQGISHGVQKIDGIEFEIRGLLHLTGRKFPIQFPEAVKGGIAVDRKCGRIHILHGTMGEASQNSMIARFRFNLEDGTTSGMNIVYGKDVKTRWFDPQDETELENPKAAWISPTDPRSSRSLRLYITSWKNPQPTLKVQSVEFISEMTPSAPFLVAITTE